MAEGQKRRRSSVSLDAIKPYRRNGSTTAVVLVSSRDGSDFGPLVPGCGACGFIPKAELSGSRIAALLE